MPHARPSFLLLAVALAAFHSSFARAQDLEIPEGYVLVDDLVLPQEVVFGDATYSATAWTGGVVPYAFDANVTTAQQLVAIDAMAEWAAAANVVFIPRTTEANWIKFKDATTNSSFVGMIGGSQTINVFNWNFRFIVCHEICHALGFWHEQQRPDRNTFVTINTANITPSAIGNFNISTGATTFGAYDFDSVMHYGQFAFSSNGQPTITVLPPNQSFQGSIGQRQHLSVLDASGAASIYGAPPPPTITTLSPASAPSGSGSITLTVDGTRFCRGANDGLGVLGSVVEWDGVALATTYVSPTQLLATVPSSLLASAGTHAVTVYNPSPLGGVSAPATFTTTGAVPTIASLSPIAATVGAATLTLTATGSNFGPTTKLRWNGADLPTTFVSGTQTTATVASSLLAAPAAVSVDAHTPGVGGGTSAPATFFVNNPPPFQLTTTPTSAAAGTGPFVVSITGIFFNGTSVVRWNGADLPTTFVSTSNVTAVVSAALAAAPGTATVAVFNPGPGGGLTAGSAFTLSNATPVLTSMTPASAPLNAVGTTLTVGGAGFNGTSKVRWNGADLATTFVSSTSLAASVPSSLLNVVGTASVTVHTPGAGGGTSAPLSFSVLPPTPVLVGLLPTSAVYGGPALTLTVVGSNFYPGVVVRWNGGDLATTYVGPTVATATVPAALLLVPGAASVVVVQTTGGTTSGAASFLVTPPQPILTSASPNVATAGSGSLAISLSGVGFAPNSQARWNGAALATTYVSSSLLTATAPSSLLTTATTATLDVSTPAPGGGVSGGLPFVVENPLPTISGLLPSQVLAGSAISVVLVQGGGFVSGQSGVRIDGVPVATSFINGSLLTATLPAAQLSVGGLKQITVFTPPPGGGTSAAATLTVLNPSPSAATLLPSSAIAGGGSVQLIVGGSGFNAATQIVFDGAPLSTVATTSSQATATVPASLLAKAKATTVVVQNPTPGGGTSSALAFSILGPALTSTTPSSAPVALPGAPPLSTTLTGLRFLPTSVVYANGELLPTTYGGPTTLLVDLPSTLPQRLARGGVALTVQNGVALSNTLVLSIDGGANMGSQITDPPAAAPPYGGVYAIILEGGAPSQPFTTFVDMATAPILAPFPDPAANFVLAVGTSAIFSPLDGLGILGPPGPFAFGPNVGGAPPGGSFTLAGIAAPAAPTGLVFTVQTLYLDPSSPTGWRLMHAASPRPY
jgi:hypothetical protein